MFVHNGAIEGFRRTAMRVLHGSLSDKSYAGLLGTTDSETIFAGLLDLSREDPANLSGATEETVRHLTRVCTKLDVRATLNLAVTDGEEMAFVRYSTEGPGNSLYFVEDGQAFPQAVVVASERLLTISKLAVAPTVGALLVTYGTDLEVQRTLYTSRPAGGGRVRPIDGACTAIYAEVSRVRERESDERGRATI
jgi:predicted glutamine amidotransferase